MAATNEGETWFGFVTERSLHISFRPAFFIPSRHAH